MPKAKKKNQDAIVECQVCGFTFTNMGETKVPFTCIDCLSSVAENDNRMIEDLTTQLEDAHKEIDRIDGNFLAAIAVANSATQVIVQNTSHIAELMGRRDYWRDAYWKKVVAKNEIEQKLETLRREDLFDFLKRKFTTKA